MIQVLKPFLESGQLDMAIFDAVNDTTIKLSRSGVLLGPGTCVNPICIVANYLFDTLCHDIFQVSDLPLRTPILPPYFCQAKRSAAVSLLNALFVVVSSEGRFASKEMKR